MRLIYQRQLDAIETLSVSPETTKEQLKILEEFANKLGLVEAKNVIAEITNSK